MRDPLDSSSSALAVPWSIHRLHDSHSLVTNAGPAPLDFVRAFVDHRGNPTGTHEWGQMLPGDTAELCLCGHEPGEIVVTLVWFRPDDGREFLWRYAQ
jgi:hypothetical protein